MWYNDRTDYLKGFGNMWLIEKRNIALKLAIFLLVLVFFVDTEGSALVYSEEGTETISTENPVTTVTTAPVTTNRGVETTTKKIVTKKKVVKKKKKKKKKKVIRLKRPKLKVKRKLEKKVRIAWKKVRKAKYYLVYKKAPGKKYKRVRKTSRKFFVDKKAKKNRKYRYYIVACRKVSGKVYRSKKSKAVTVKVRAKKKKPKPKKQPKPVEERADVVVCGECYVEGMALYAKSMFPSNYRLIYKVGISTYGLLNTNFLEHNGMTVTAVERIAYYRPKQVFFLTGMNEASRPNPTSTLNNYRQIIYLLKKVNPSVKIVIMALPPVAKNHVSGFANNPQIKKYNAAYKKLAKHYSNVFYYSGYRKLITDSEGYLKPYANGGDGGHWSYQATIDVVRALKNYSAKVAKK